MSALRHRESLAKAPLFSAGCTLPEALPDPAQAIVRRFPLCPISLRFIIIHEWMLFFFAQPAAAGALLLLNRQDKYEGLHVMSNRADMYFADSVIIIQSNMNLCKYLFS